MASLFDHMNPAGDAAIPSDPCAGRHKGNQQSAEAWERARDRAPVTRQIILEYIQKSKLDGRTLKDIAIYLTALAGEMVQLNQFSGRISELKQQKKIVDSGRRRGGCAVLVSSEMML